MAELTNTPGLKAWRARAEVFTSRGFADMSTETALRLEALSKSEVFNEAASGFVEQQKWLVSSAWQKAVRRGEVERATCYAQTYHALDPAAFWRRIPVVAIEDIGVANPELVFAIMWVCGKHVWRQQRAPDWAWAALLSRELANSMKDRTCCDLVVCAENDPDLAGFRKWAFDGAYGNQLLDIVNDPEVYLLKRMIALWALGGTRLYRGGNDIPEKHPGYPERFLQRADVEPPLVRWLMTSGANKTQDAMPLAFSLLLPMAMEGSLTVKHACIFTDGLLNHLPTYAYDQHTGLGKKALRYFAINCGPVRDFLFKGCGFETLDDAAAALGSMIFRVESTRLDRTFLFEGASEIYDLCETARFRQRGIPPHLLGEARKIVHNNLSWLDHARAHVLGKTTMATVPPTAWNPHDYPSIQP